MLVNDSELLRLAKILQAEQTSCLILDTSAVSRVACDVLGIAAGEPVATAIPTWSRDAVPGLYRTMEQRWVRLEPMATSDDLTLYAVFDRTCERVGEEARQLQARRSARANLAGATAREMNDAMTIVQGRLELLRSFALEDPTAAERHCNIALEHSSRLSSSLHNLRLVGASTVAEAQVLPVLELLSSALERMGLATASVQLDLHPGSMAICGFAGATVSVLEGVLRAVGTDGRDVTTIRGRMVNGRVLLDLERLGRRRELDALPLGIASILLDAVGGSMDLTTEGQIRVDLPGIDGAVTGVEGTILVVGAPHFVECVERLFTDTEVRVVSENSAETALRRAAEDDVSGVVSDLLLPEHCGLWLCEEVAHRNVAQPYGAILMTPEPIEGLPSTVRLLTAPWSRNRLLAALVQS